MQESWQGSVQQQLCDSVYGVERRVGRHGCLAHKPGKVVESSLVCAFFGLEILAGAASLFCAQTNAVRAATARGAWSLTACIMMNDLATRCHASCSRTDRDRAMKCKCNEVGFVTRKCRAVVLVSTASLLFEGHTNLW